MPAKSEEGISPHGTGFINGCKPTCGYWELNLGSLQEQQVLFTMVHLSSPSRWFFFLLYFFWGGGWVDEEIESV